MELFGKKKLSLKVEGMTCGHCVMHVKKALEEIRGVKKAEVNLEKGTAVIILDRKEPASIDSLIKAVEDAGYIASKG